MSKKLDKSSIIGGEVSIDSLPYEFNCPKCGEKICLWFNGGELDQKECCGYMYALEHEKIIFTVRKLNDSTKQE